MSRARQGVRGRAAPPRPLRIALVATSLRAPGGQGVQAQALVRLLREEGHDVLFLPIDPPFPAGFCWLRRLPYARTLLNQALYLPSLLRLRRSDVLHAFSASHGSFLLAPLPAILAARALGLRSVLVYHSGEAEQHLARGGKLLHPWLRLVDEIVVPSEFLQAAFARHGYGARVIYNVVDTSSFRYAEREPLRPRLISTRNLEPHYRVDNTLRAFALLRRRWPEASLTIAGYGSQEAALKQLAASLGLDSVRFLGALEPGAMPDLYAQADIFVNSSEVDNQPVSVLEAFAAGLPVVSTGTGGIRDLVRHGETGLVVAADDPAEMAEAVTRLIENPERARRLARRSRQEVEKYTWQHVRELWTRVSVPRVA